MRIGGDAKLKALFIVSIGFYVACFACVFQASQTVDSSGWKASAYFWLIVGSATMLYAWYLSHRDSDGSHRSALYESIARRRAEVKLRNGQCRRCGRILPDDATAFCSECEEIRA